MDQCMGGWMGLWVRSGEIPKNLIDLDLNPQKFNRS